MIRDASSDMVGEDNGQPNLTPLIDVVFMLIVFLLLTANAAQFVVTVDLPQASSAVASENKSLVLQPPMEEGGRWLLDGQAFENTQALRPALRKAVAEDQERVLVIVIDASASSQRLIDAMDIATEAGAKAVEISAENRSE
jgi:biopolymer transport protein ExbD